MLRPLLLSRFPSLASTRMTPPTRPQARLQHVLSALQPSSSTPPQQRELLGTLRVGELALPIYETDDPGRLAREGNVLDMRDGEVVQHLEWMLRKAVLGQDIFLLTSPGPAARKLASTFASLLHKPVEIVSLHRDVGESEIKQGRELREGGKLVWVDSAAVRAAKGGGVLVLDGVERCERGVLPLLNNLLENREINLEDGTHIVSADRYEKMLKNGEDTSLFIPASREFRVVAIGTPVPPYPGFPLDPPFRSRFQARYLDSLSTGKILATQPGSKRPQDSNGKEMVEKVAEAIALLQVGKELRARMASGVPSSSSSEIPSFPQTALLKLSTYLTLFPLPSNPTLSTPAQMANLLLTIHPALAFMPQPSWRALEEAFERAGLGEWMAGVAESDWSAVGLEGEGIGGWVLEAIERKGEREATLSFSRGGVEKISLDVAAGPLPFAPYPLTPEAYPDIYLTPRFQHLLTSFLQLHALGSFDISFLPPSSSLQSSSSSTTILIETFASLLGYSLETIHLYKELGGRELWMRRVVNSGADGKSGGVTSWEPSLMTKGAWEGKLVHLEGIDALGATAGSLGRLLCEREGELWEGQRLVGPLKEGETTHPLLSHTHPSFRIIATSSKSTPPRDWLTEELSSNFISLPTLAMPLEEETAILRATGCPSSLVKQLETFARAYRRANAAPGSKSRRLGTASLVRIAKRLAKFPEEGLFGLLNRTLLSEFLPTTDKVALQELFKQTGVEEAPIWWNPPSEVSESEKQLVFPAASDPQEQSKPYKIPLFDMAQDPEGASHVPYMTNYLDNSQQTALMRDIATDLEVLGEHILLLGNQGVGKNKIIDRLLQLLNRPSEYIQLHRDTTTQSLMFQTTLEGGVIRYVDSPLLRAVSLGRVLVIDEVDKAAAPVVAGLASLAGRGEMTLADGRRIRPAHKLGQDGDIIVHPNFRLILLANRPGYPFLGNPFLRVLGDNFSCYSVSNPDSESEQRVLSQLAPDLDPELLRSLVGAFGDLRKAFDAGTLSYPFSLRELLALVRHLKRFPDDSLESVLRNVFDFDVSRPEVLDTLYMVLRRHKLNVERIGIDAVRGQDGDEKKVKVIEFEPKGDTSLSEPPKFGKEDNKVHVGGNTWAGGTGGRSTAGLGGRGGYMRLYKPGDIHQIPDSLKAQVPDEVKSKARDMARKELAARLAEIDLTSGQASIYSGYHDAVAAHVQQLVTFLDNLEANEEERIWLKRQGDGELDDSRLADGLTGEATIYKRRGVEKPELGRPQLKPKRIRFVVDSSASMYRNQYDGRLTRSLEAITMILESFSRLQRKEKYRIDIVGHSGEEAVIPLVPLDTLAGLHAGDFYKVIQKAALIPQFVWAGDHTLEAIEQGVAAVVDSDSDDFFLIVLTDANFERYGIEPEDLKKVMNSNPKVKTSLIAIGEGAEAEWLPSALPGKAHRVKNTGDIATTLRAILSSMLGGEL